LLLYVQEFLGRKTTSKDTKCSREHENSVVKSAKLEVGERYIQVWAPDNGRVPFPGIITIAGGRTLWAINWRWGRSLASHYTLTTARITPRNTMSQRHNVLISQKASVIKFYSIIESWRLESYTETAYQKNLATPTFEPDSPIHIERVCAYCEY